MIYRIADKPGRSWVNIGFRKDRENISPFPTITLPYSTFLALSTLISKTQHSILSQQLPQPRRFFFFLFYLMGKQYKLHIIQQSPFVFIIRLIYLCIYLLAQNTCRFYKNVKVLAKLKREARNFSIKITASKN